VFENAHLLLGMTKRPKNDLSVSRKNRVLPRRSIT
jgi:hypothetical protein